MTILFPDISHYDWERGLTTIAGAPILIAKATQGISYVDPTYTRTKALATELGIPLAAYHWLDTRDAGEQARHAYSVVGPNTVLMIDDEQNIINVPHTLAFVQAYRALGGVVRLEYAPRWVWLNSGQPDLRPLAAAGLTLVSSHYVSNYSDSGPGWDPYGGVWPGAWQWTSSRPWNGSDRTDWNAWRGTLVALIDLLTIGGTPMGSDQVDELRDVVTAIAIGATDLGPVPGNTGYHVWGQHQNIGTLNIKLDKVTAQLDKILVALAADPGNPMTAEDLAAFKAALAEEEQKTRDAIVAWLAERQQALVDAAAAAARSGAAEAAPAIADAVVNEEHDRLAG